LPHDPQLAGSVCLLTQALPQADRPALHANPQVPLLQVGVPPDGAEQALPHEPQFAGSL
jgi:hypothetical protein